MVISSLRMVTMLRNMVAHLIKNSAFCLNQTLKVYLCPTQCIGCSACSHESRSQNISIIWECVLVMSMKKCQNGAFSMPQCSLMNMGTPIFLFQN